VAQNLEEVKSLRVREMLEERERKTLSPFATLSSQSQGRKISESECDTRTSFQRDRDRIIHSKSFRRLAYKTQVFLAPAGDHYRTRLTHTLEVAQIARTISKALRLNEDLTEAIALGHDLGHTPFGHAGEDVLNEVYPHGFRHNEQGLRVVEVLENEGKGLNLTLEVRDGILNHSKFPEGIYTYPGGEKPLTLEGEVVRISDIIAYINHDIDDALRAELITLNDLPPSGKEVLGKTHSQRINSMVTSIIQCSWDKPEIRMGEPVLSATEELRRYLYENVYPREEIQREIIRAKRILRDLYFYLRDNPKFLFSKKSPEEISGDIICLVKDFLAGMTDRYALNLYQKLFLPRPWPAE